MLKVALLTLAAIAPISQAAPAKEVVFPDAAAVPVDVLYDGNRDGRRSRSVGQAIRNDDRLRRFSELLNREAGSGFFDDIDRKNRDVTIFAPNNEAIREFEREQEEDRDRRRDGNRRNRDHDGRPRDDDNNDLDRDDEERNNIQDVLQYHVARDVVINTQRDFFDGQLIETNLRNNNNNRRRDDRDDRDERRDNDRRDENHRQFIRVFRFRENDVYLNARARIVGQIQTDNGVVFIVDRVLSEPQSIRNTIVQLPTQFSTSAVAFARAGLLNELQNDRQITALVPDNDAWKRLGFRNLYYLFSNEGRDDLERILRYHIANELWYSAEIVREERVRLDTLNNRETVEIEARARNHRDGNRRGRDEDRDGRRRDHDDARDDDRDNRRRRDDERDGRRRNDDDVRDDDRDNRRHRGDRDGRRHDDVDFSDSYYSPNRWLFTVNHGEATVEFTDAITRNGNILVIDRVLVPRNVELPSEERNH